MNPTIERPVTLDEVVVEEVPHIETLCDPGGLALSNPFPARDAYPDWRKEGGR